jgi:hypothetical protein
MPSNKEVFRLMLAHVLAKYGVEACCIVYEMEGTVCNSVVHTPDCDAEKVKAFQTVSEYSQTALDKEDIT